MKSVLTPAEAAELDRATQESGTPAHVLMERAGWSVARAAIDICGGVYGRRALVICGKGNNGGDGLVAARHLSRQGMKVEVFAVEPLSGSDGAAAINAGRLTDETGVVIRRWSPIEAADRAQEADVVIDAIFGTGFHGKPEGAHAEAIDVMNSALSPVVAVDIPSGVDGLTADVDGDAVWADLTITFGAAKVGVVALPGAERAGQVRVVDIGFDEEAINARAFVPEPSDIAEWLPWRPFETHKRASGVLLVLAGSRAMTGAAALIAGAAARAGAGLVNLAVPRGILPVVEALLPEAVFLPLPETSEGNVAAAALDALAAASERADAVAVGPGLGTEEETAELIRGFLTQVSLPAVLDADGLNAFAGRAGELTRRDATTVITPHAGEFSRLSPDDAGNSDRLEGVRALAAETGAVTLLKGSRSLIGCRDGSVLINPTGTPALATAGTGDVLTGIIGAFLARGLAPEEAAGAGAFIHGVAGSLAAEGRMEGAVASDVVGAVPAAVAKVLGMAWPGILNEDLSANGGPA